MAKKFHINDAGETGVCSASVKDCKFSGNGESSGAGADGHFYSKEEAQAGAEVFMENKYKEVYKGYRRGESEGMDLAAPMKKRLIKEAQDGSKHVFPASIGRVLSKDKDELIRKTIAETLSSQKLLRDMSDDESARVRKAVALRTNNREVLAKLANDPDGAVRHAAINNAKTPVKARKAAQAAIREANIRNLSKIREAANPVTNSKPASAKAWDAFEDARVDRNGSLTPSRRAPREKALAEIHGVSQDKVSFDSISQNTQVKVGGEIQIYGPQGENRGKASAAIEKKLDSVRSKADALKKRTLDRGQEFLGSPRLSEGLLKAHGEGSGLSKTKPTNFPDSYYNVKSGKDGNTYVYEANTYRLIEVKG